jgi:hypothetical protein
MVGSVPSTFAAMGDARCQTPMLHLNPTSRASAGAVLSKAEVEKSMQERMTALEELPQFRSDPALEGALPQEVRCVRL